MVVEAGAHELPGGTWIEAGKSYSTGEFREIKFNHEFLDVPVVFSQITTEEIRTPYTVR